MPIIQSGSPVAYFSEKKTTYRLSQDFIWKSNEGIQYLVPKGFTTDVATIPFPVSLAFKWGVWHYAAILHDWGCTHAYVMVLEETGCIKYLDIERRHNDSLFKACLLDLGVSPAKAQFLYLGVRLWSRMQPLVGEEPRLAQPNQSI
jgi:hypothetical protein